MPSDKKPSGKAPRRKSGEAKQDVTAIPLDFEENNHSEARAESVGGVLEAARRKREETEEYEKQDEPELSERSYNWKTAIGLQQVDGLTPSKYLIDTANANIEGKISIDEAEQFITDYYAHRPEGVKPEERTEEADKVSVRIARILSGKTFKLSPAQLISIHKRLFDGIYDFAGKIRDYNISKKEWVLKGNSVYYGDYSDLKTFLDYDFDREKSFDYGSLEPRAAAEHIAKFIADVWQIHAFGEGNTRTIAVFAVKYLRTFGYDVKNDTFERHSFYFRNALVRANYNSHTEGVKATPVYLNRFFGNLLFGEQNELQSRELQIGLKPGVLDRLDDAKRQVEAERKDAPNRGRNDREDR
jgi:fido (protein-threonine AMPylation protein)